MKRILIELGLIIFGLYLITTVIMGNSDTSFKKQSEIIGNKSKTQIESTLNNY